MSRARPGTETAEYVKFVRRIIRAHGRRVANNDIAELAALVAVRDEVDAAIRTAVTELHDEHGYSWAKIGAELGISRVSAFQRFSA
jgi:uncharacterized protein with PIN domain